MVAMSLKKLINMPVYPYLLCEHQFLILMFATDEE